MVQHFVQLVYFNRLVQIENLLLELSAQDVVVGCFGHVLGHFSERRLDNGRVVDGGDAQYDRCHNARVNQLSRKLETVYRTVCHVDEKGVVEHGRAQNRLHISVRVNIEHARGVDSPV